MGILLKLPMNSRKKSCHKLIMHLYVIDIIEEVLPEAIFIYTITSTIDHVCAMLPLSLLPYKSYMTAGYIGKH